MTWLQSYRLRHFFLHSIWFMPFLCMLAAMGLVRLSFWIDQTYQWQSPIHVDTARAVLGTLAASMFTFVVFVSSALLVAVQLASAQLTPRIIGVVFRSPVMRAALSLFVFTFTFSLAALIRISETVPSLTVQVAAYSCVASMVMFLYMIDHVGRVLRPSGALRSVANYAKTVIKSVYPNKLTDRPALSGELAQRWSGAKLTEISSKNRDGVVMAFNVAGLAKLAEQNDCVIEMVPQVGDHIAGDEPLFRIYGGKAPISEIALSQFVAMGMERTLEQDPTFAFRIMVDIASKGLSPAINDPTTAVLALDQIHRLLRYVGTRDLDTGLVYDTQNRLRLVYRTPDWEDFVYLAVTEIRHFGSDSIQIARRMRAMLENLIDVLPQSRRPLLQTELDILKRSTDRFFSEPEDRALAEESDAQGVGGKSEST